MLSAEHCRPRYVPTEAQRFPRGKAPFARTGRETLHLQQCTLVRRPARVVPACRHSCAPRLRLALSCAAEESQCVGSLVQSRDLESGVAAGGTHAATLTPFASQSRAWSCSKVRRPLWITLGHRLCTSGKWWCARNIQNLMGSRPPVISLTTGSWTPGDEFSPLFRVIDP